MFFSGHFQTKGKTAVIVGASQGVGASLASKLHSEGCSVILVARTEAKLKLQVESLRSNQADSHAHYVACDVSSYDGCIRLWDEIERMGADPDIIFCCAGSSVPKLFQDLTKDDLAAGVSTNYNTALYVCHTGFKQSLRRELKPRHIVLFSSVVSFFPFIGYGQYAPMKAAVESLSLVLRQELAPYNYRVSCIFPGNFLSEGYDDEQKTKPAITSKIEGPSSPISSDECASIILSKLDKGYDTVTTDFVGWLLGCGSLGFLPREWSLLQVIMSFVLSVVAPVVNWSIRRDIRKETPTKEYQEKSHRTVEKED